MFKIILLDVLMFTPLYIPVAVAATHHLRDASAATKKFFTRSAAPAVAPREPALAVAAAA